MMFWRLYGGRRYEGDYVDGTFEYTGFNAFDFSAGIHPGRPSEELSAPNVAANVTDGSCFIYTQYELRTAEESGEGDYIRWEGRWWHVMKVMRHTILLPHKRYLAMLADLPIPDENPTADIFATIIGQGTVTGQGTYPINSIAVLEAVPAVEWEFVNWSRSDGEVIADPTNPVQEIVVPERGLVLEARFKDTMAFVNVIITGQGTVNGAGRYLIGSTASLEAVPIPGYIFSRWIVGSSQIEDNPLEVQVPAEGITVTAIFAVET